MLPGLGCVWRWGVVRGPLIGAKKKHGDTILQERTFGTRMGWAVYLSVLLNLRFIFHCKPQARERSMPASDAVTRPPVSAEVFGERGTEGGLEYRHWEGGL